MARTWRNVERMQLKEHLIELSPSIGSDLWGSSVVYLLVGLKYDTNVWRAVWPRIMRNAI